VGKLAPIVLGTLLVVLAAAARAGGNHGSAAFALPANPAATPTQAAGGGMESVALAAGCNPVAATWPNGTSVATVAAAVTPPAALDAIWKFDPPTSVPLGYSPAAPPEVNDLVVVNRLDAIFVCMSEPGAIVRPRGCACQEPAR